VEAVAADVKNQDAAVESDFNSGRFAVVGVDPDYLAIRSLPTGQGRSISWLDVEQTTRVCVLGAEVRKQLFADRPDVIGRSVRIRGHPYRIVGLMNQKAERAGNYDGRDNEKIVVPVSSLVKDFPPFPEAVSRGRVSTIVYRPRSADQWKRVQQQVRAVLARRQAFDPRDQAATPIRDTMEVAELTEGMNESLRKFLGSVALITLSLGGLGITNMMMTSITERTSEIGLKKALGATRRRILIEFTLEGLLLAGIAGASGIILVSVLAALVNQLPMPPFFAGLALDARMVLGLTLTLGAVAVLSVLPPAWKAANLTPVEALKFEK
jgi:putative ABC transport system permease protein